MISVTIINIFFQDALGLNYSSVAFYKNAYNILAILLLPFFGKLLSHIDPRRFAALTFAALFMYIFFLLMTEYFPGHVEILGIQVYFMLVISFLFYGVFAAMMALLWFIGSAYFCKPEEADDYQSVHLSLTGVRSLFAPVFGVYFYELIGFSATFILTLAVLLVAARLTGVRRQASGTRRQAPGVRLQVSGIWYLVSGIWYPASGIRHLVSGIRYLVSGIHNLRESATFCHPNSIMLQPKTLNKLQTKMD